MNKYLFFITYFVFSFMQVFCQSDESSNLTYGMKLYDDKIYDVAITQFKNFLEQYGSSVSAPKVQYFLAESYMESGDKENALRNYQRLIMDYPKSEYCETSILKAAELYNETGDKEKAARYYLQLKNYFPNSNQIPESYYKAIVLFREIGMTEQVKDNTALLQKSYHDNNFTKLSQIILAGIYESENQIKLADRTFYEILRSSAGDIKTKAGLEYSLFLERQNSLSEARRILKEAFKGVSKKDRNYFPLLVRLTKMLLNSNGYDEAGKLLDGEKNIPDEFKADINSLKGELDFFKGNYSTALKFFEDALKSGIVPETEIKRAHTLNSLKEFEKAGDAFFDAAVSGAGNDQEMINYSLTGASNNYFASGNYEKGVLVLKKYLELFPHEKNSSKINFMIGRSFYDSGKYSAGYELLKNQPVNYPMSEYNDDAVFLAGECAFKMQNWRNAYDQHDYLIRNFGASEFKALSVSRLKYLNDYKIRENDLTDKLADLSSRSIFEENRSKLFFDWARFYFYDMKDYARASEFIDKYTVLLKNGDIGQEGKFIKAVCIIRLKSTEKDALRNSFEILRSILADPNTLRNLRFKAAGEMLDMAGGVYEGAELESASDNVFGILKKDQTDDIDGTLAFRYFSIKSKLTSTLSLIQSINEVFQSKTNSIYYADTELIKAELYRTGGDLANSNMILKKLSDSDNNGYPALKSLNILSEDPSESAESKIIYLSKIEDKFFYTTSFIEINERKAKVYFDDGKLERSLVLYESLNKELNKGVIASSWNFSEKDYSKNIADIYFALGELNKAETFYQKALSNRNASLDRQYILLKLAEIYKSQNNKTALEENYKALSSVSGGDSSYLAAVALADIDLEKNNITKAINQYEDILKKYKPEDRKP
ncbi:MAG: tetratricopeptide repeat protein, partial [Candidatus Delongbacteria bacterium]|nr:tetratricopeptide repeat protein [Candidatus Delongbacteria bacterium]